MLAKIKEVLGIKEIVDEASKSRTTN